MTVGLRVDQRQKLEKVVEIFLRDDEIPKSPRQVRAARHLDHFGKKGGIFCIGPPDLEIGIR